MADSSPSSPSPPLSVQLTQIALDYLTSPSTNRTALLLRWRVEMTGYPLDYLIGILPRLTERADELKRRCLTPGRWTTTESLRTALLALDEAEARLGACSVVLRLKGGSCDGSFASGGNRATGCPIPPMRLTSGALTEF